MKKMLFLAIVISMIVISFIGCSKSGNSADVKYDFRNTTWGMSTDNVINSEGSPPDKSDGDTLYYFNKSVSGLSADVVYKFNNNNLQEGLYFIKDQNYIDDYNILKEALTSKYGEPYINNEPSYNADLSGDFSYGTDWKTASSDIFLSLQSFNNNIMFGLMYKKESNSGAINTNGL